MDRATQQRLAARVAVHRAAGRGTDTSGAAMRVPVTDYTDPDVLAAERRLMAAAPTVVGLSRLIPEPGAFATVTVGDAPVVLTRTDAGDAAAFVNVCRHRGAPVADGCGRAVRLQCPYHGWTYHLDGRAAGRRRTEFFDDVVLADLFRLPLLEQHGLLWVSADPGATIPDDPLQGAAHELAPFDLAGYRLFARTRLDRPLNWKLAVETFCEAYHLRTLHATTLDPLIHSDFAVFDPFGHHGRLGAVRRSIDGLDLTDPDLDLVAHTTLLWFLVPNVVLIFQQDHVQLYVCRPGAHPGAAELDISVYVPLTSDRPESHWQRNFDLLVEVTDTEDFSTAAAIQRGFAAGAQDSLVFGRNEPALQHFHRSIGELIASYAT